MNALLLTLVYASSALALFMLLFFIGRVLGILPCRHIWRWLGQGHRRCRHCGREQRWNPAHNRWEEVPWRLTSDF
jgi:hypothetical protein